MPEPLRSLRALDLAVSLRKPIRGASDRVVGCRSQGGSSGSKHSGPDGMLWPRAGRAVATADNQVSMVGSRVGVGWRSPAGKLAQGRGGLFASLTVAHHKHWNVY